MKRALFVVTVALIVSLCAPAFADEPGDESFPSDRVLSFDESAIVLYVGARKTLSPQVTRAAETAPKKTSLLWSSSDARVAKVSAKGAVTGVSPGEAVITCRAADDEAIAASVAVRVAKPVKKLKLSGSGAVLTLTTADPALARLSLALTLSPEDAEPPEIVWTSSDPSVASVDQAGGVLALKRGEATITATARQEGLEKVYARRVITVSQAAEIITLSRETLTLNKGRSLTLSAAVSPKNANRKAVAWSTSDASVAVVNQEGRVTAKGVGECVVTCAAKDGFGASAACRVTVEQWISAIKLNKTSLTARIGGEGVELLATLTPADVTDDGLIWSSSNPDVAVVSSRGVVYAVGAGKCRVTCTARDGGGKTASASVYVPSIVVERDAYTVDNKHGALIPVTFYGESISFTTSTSAYFDADWIEDWFGNTTYIIIVPKKAGSAVVTLADEQDEKSRIKITVTIDQSAVYDTVSYPRASREDILRDPDGCAGENLSLYGKVLRKTVTPARTVLRVGTGGSDQTEAVFQIEYVAQDLDPGVSEGDFVTVYGKCLGARVSVTDLGESETLPALTAERIVVGKSR